MLRTLSKSTNVPISIQSDPNNPKSQNVQLIVGMPLIAHKKCIKLGIVNTDRFVVAKIEKVNLTIKSLATEEEITLKISEFNKYFYLAYCITIHSSQGETFKDKYTIYDWNLPVVDKRAKYVSLSRGTNISNIQID